MNEQAIAFLNGQFLPLSEARISPLDRGFLFADGVYEVIPVYAGTMFRLEPHLQRLNNSLAAIRLSLQQDWSTLLTTLIERNGGGNLYLYLQITRGAPAVREHAFPTEAVTPTVFAMARPLKPQPEQVLSEGMSLALVDDLRWQLCHIKSVALLANVLARQEAVERGCNDALLVRDGHLTETSAGNVFLIKDGVIYTPPKDQHILHGITREVILELAAASQISVREQAIPVDFLEQADEVWLSSTTRELVSVTHVNNNSIGNGKPGPLWRRLWTLYQDAKARECGLPTSEP